MPKPGEQWRSFKTPIPRPAGIHLQRGGEEVAAQRSVPEPLGMAPMSSNALRAKISSIERSFRIFQYGF
jgi:hypothetical protein